jgi:hypothetical protein
MAIDVNVAAVTVKRVTVRPVLIATAAARVLIYIRIPAWFFVLMVILPAVKCDLVSLAAVTVTLVTMPIIVHCVKQRTR